MGTTNPSSFILQTAGSIGPNATDTYNLGSSALEWNNAYIKNITSSATSGNFGFWQLNSGVLSPATQTNTLSVGTTGSLGTLDVRNLTGTLATASISGQTSFAGLVVDNSGKGDLFTASASGLSRFVITQAGNVGINTTAPFSTPGLSSLMGMEFKSDSNHNPALVLNDGAKNSFQYTFTNSGGAFYIKDATNGNAQFNFRDTNNKDYVTIKNGSLGINDITPDTKAIFSVQGVISNATNTRNLSGTIPMASISGQTSFAGLVVDNSGAGDLFTASSSGLSRFVITQAGNVGYWDNVPRERARQLGRFAVPIGHG